MRFHLSTPEERKAHEAQQTKSFLTLAVSYLVSISVAALVLPFLLTWGE